MLLMVHFLNIAFGGVFQKGRGTRGRGTRGHRDKGTRGQGDRPNGMEMYSLVCYINLS